MRQVVYYTFCVLTLLFSNNGFVCPYVLLTNPYTPKHTSTFMDEYDYIVVGAGSAGSVVASRLSEMSCVNVLLLEAGGKPTLLTEVPALLFSAFRTHVDWEFKTVPQKYSCFALQNRQYPIVAGKMLGGGSSINAMMYVRGNRNDFNGWAAAGAKGWSYEEVLPYFLKLEGNRNPAFVATGYHNSSGPVTVEDAKYRPLLKRQLEKAINELGYNTVDINGRDQTGFYDSQGNTRNSRRCSSAKAYLVPAEKRPNLHIVTKAMVTKIIIVNRRAVGVMFDYKGKTYRVKASREVIVSAGAFKTPQLLMLSGVGPRAELEKFNIPVLADLPVGRNLHDHVMTILFYELGPSILPIYLELSKPENIEKYISEGSGPYSSLAFTLYTAFLKGPTVHPLADYPNYQLMINDFTSAEPMIMGFNFKPEVFDTLLKPYKFRPLMACMGLNIKPRSRGTITLHSTNIYDNPLIDPNYLQDSRDYDAIVQGLETCQKLANTESMRKVGARLISTVMPGCEQYVGNETSYFRCYLQQFTASVYHFAGTAKMGDPRDPRTVVDPELRVKNIAGLRVADASVMPQVTSGNPNVPIMMIGEKVSDMIKETIDPKEQCRNLNKRRKIISPPVEENKITEVIETVKLETRDRIHKIKLIARARAGANAVEKNGLLENLRKLYKNLFNFITENSNRMIASFFRLW